MSRPEDSPIPFEDLPDILKPEMCDFHFTSPKSILDRVLERDTIIGYRMGDPNIYYTGGDPFSSSAIPLPNLLENAPLDAFQDVLLWEKDKLSLFKLWNSAQERKRSGENG